MSREIGSFEMERPEWITDKIARKMRYLEEMWINLQIRPTGTKEYRRLEELADNLVSKIVKLGETHPRYDPLWMVKGKEELLLNRKTD